MVDNIMGFNTFDVVVIVLILLLSLKGLFSGFTKEFFNSLGLIGGIFVASYFHKTVANYIFNNITDAISLKVLNLISLVYMVIKLIGKAFAMIGSDDDISAASRLGGMIVKLVTLFFVFSLITYAISTKKNVVEKIKDITDTSILYPLLKDTGASILNMPIIANTSNTAQEQTNTNSNSNVEVNNTAPTNTEAGNTTTDINNNEATNTATENNNNSSEANNVSDNNPPAATYNTDANNTNTETNSTQN